MTRAMEQLTQVQHKAAEALYKQSGAGAGAGAGAGGAGPEGASSGSGARTGGGAGTQGDVIDAEVVDEEKK
jgi:molecular chaperone DnaK